MCHFCSNTAMMLQPNPTEQIGTNLFNFIFDELSMNYSKEQFS